MTQERMRAALRLSCDDRLVAGVGGAVAHFAGRAGLEDVACDSLVTALEDLCRDTLLLLDAPTDTLDVEIADFPDRLEIVVEHRTVNRSGGNGSASGDPPANDPPSGGVQSAFAPARLMLAVDQVEHITHNGNMQTRLIKYIHSRNGNS